MSNMWFINNHHQIEHSVTGETSNFGYNGELYDRIPEGESAGFTLLITNTLIANKLIKQGITRYLTDTVLKSGEELVVRLPIEYLTKVIDLMGIFDTPNIKHRLAIANRS